MKIANTQIGPGHPPYVVAEISGNHCGLLENAKRLIKAAKRAGADAVKTQCYEPDTLTLDIKKPDFIVQSGLWKGRTLYDVYQKAHTPFAWHKDLYSLAKNEGITIFSSVFDKKGVDFLDALDVPAYKIASFEIVDIPLIEYAASTGKPVIISTGLANDAEIKEADDASGGKAAFLHCTSEYPGLVSDADLSRILHIDSLLGFQNVVGISDHTAGFEVPIAATALRAYIIEKHLKLAVYDKGSFVTGSSIPEDDQFSVEPLVFQSIVHSIHAVWEGMKTHKPDGAGRQFRRSIYAVADIKKGEKFTVDNIRSIRPAYGLPPKMLPKLLGSRSKRNWRRGEPLS